MKWLTIASCLVVVMLGALVAPSMTSELSSASARERLLRLFMEARKKKGGGKKGDKKSSESDESDEKGDNALPAEEGTDSHHDGGSQEKVQAPNWLADCENGDLDHEDFCAVIFAAAQLNAARDPCTHAAVVLEPTGEEIDNCEIKIDNDMANALAAPSDKEFFEARNLLMMQIESLAKALGIITPEQWAKVEAVEAGLVDVDVVVEPQ